MGIDPVAVADAHQYVAQLTLFDSTDPPPDSGASTDERALVDDERGRVTCIPRFVDGETAQAWFVELRDAVKWRGERITSTGCARAFRSRWSHSARRVV